MRRSAVGCRRRHRQPPRRRPGAGPATRRPPAARQAPFGMLRLRGPAVRRMQRNDAVQPNPASSNAAPPNTPTSSTTNRWPETQGVRQDPRLNGAEAGGDIGSTAYDRSCSCGHDGGASRSGGPTFICIVEERDAGDDRHERWLRLRAQRDIPHIAHDADDPEWTQVAVHVAELNDLADGLWPGHFALASDALTTSNVGRVGQVSLIESPPFRRGMYEAAKRPLAVRKPA